MMFTSRVFLSVAAGVLFFSDPGLNRLQAQTPPNMQRLAEELKSLRKVLFQDLYERQTEKVDALQKEFDQIQRECKQIETALDAQEREITEWLNELQSSELSPPERAQAEIAKREANGEAAQKLRTKHAGAVTRQAELVQRLSREKDRLRRLRESLDALPR